MAKVMLLDTKISLSKVSSAVKGDFQWLLLMCFPQNVKQFSLCNFVDLSPLSVNRNMSLLLGHYGRGTLLKKVLNTFPPTFAFTLFFTDYLFSHPRGCVIFFNQPHSHILYRRLNIRYELTFWFLDLKLVMNSW